MKRNKKLSEIKDKWVEKLEETLTDELTISINNSILAKVIFLGSDSINHTCVKDYKTCKKGNNYDIVKSNGKIIIRDDEEYYDISEDTLKQHFIDIIEQRKQKLKNIK